MRGAGYRLAGATAGSLALLMIVGGLLHLPAARPLLMRLAALCPVETNPALVEPLQREAVGHLRGDAPIPSDETAPLRLLQLSTARLDDWARRQGLTCEASQGAFRSLSCHDVPAAALGRQHDVAGVGYELVVSQNAAGHPLAVSVLVRNLDAQRGAATLMAVRDELDGALGASPPVSGAITPAALARPFHGVSAEYRFSNRVVRVAATNIPGSGVVVRELYLISDGA